jgi:hypothetical protein
MILFECEFPLRTLDSMATVVALATQNMDSHWPRRILVGGTLAGAFVLGGIWSRYKKVENATEHSAAPVNSPSKTADLAGSQSTALTRDTRRTVEKSISETLSQKIPGEQKVESIRLLLEATGSPSDKLVKSTSQLYKSLSEDGIVDDWHCYRAGCFLHVKNSDNYREFRSKVMESGNRFHPDGTLIITGDEPPNKLLILIADNVPQ